MELRGTIKKIGEIQTFNSFEKRELVFQTDENYPQTLSIEIQGQKIDIIDPFKVDDYVILGVNLKGREWVSPQGETKYFNTIVAWKIVRPQ